MLKKIDALNISFHNQEFTVRFKYELPCKLHEDKIQNLNSIHQIIVIPSIRYKKKFLI